MAAKPKKRKTVYLSNRKCVHGVPWKKCVTCNPALAAKYDPTLNPNY